MAIGFFPPDEGHRWDKLSNTLENCFMDQNCKRVGPIAWVLLLTFLCGQVALAANKYDDTLFKGMKWRSIYVLLWRCCWRRLAHYGRRFELEATV